MSAGESRKQEALRRLNEATTEGFRRSPRGLGSVRVTVDDSADGREVDVDRERSVNVRREPPRR